MSNSKNHLMKTDHSLHITIGTYPSPSLSLDQDIKLLKAAILYGDHVELYSLTASIIAMTMKLKKVPIALQISMLETVTPYIQTQEEASDFLARLRVYKELASQKSKSRQAIIQQRKFEDGMTQSWASIRGVIEEISRKSGFEHLNRVLQSGILKLHSFSSMKTQQQAMNYIADCVILATKSPLINEHRPQMKVRDDQILDEFVQGMSSAVSNGTTLPLFDEQTSSLVKAGISFGAITPTESALSRGRHSALAAHLLGRLPLFENASLDQVIEIRKELDRPLIRFRSALVKFSDSIKSAPWDNDFPPDAEVIFLRDVAPAILDIEDAIKSNNFIASIVRSLTDKPLVLPSGSAIGLALSNFTTLPDALALSLGVGSATSSIVYDAYKAWQEKNLQVEQNTMYFYYQAGEKLKR